MKINKHNYEKYFLDYHEGNLPAELVAELFIFLESHPDLKAEFESFENISLSDPPVFTFPDKDLLKKGTLDESNYSRYFVAYVEGTLNHHEKLMVKEFLIKFPQYKKELALFEKTKLIPDPAIVYAEKHELKKPVPLFAERKTWYYIAAAACILLLLGVFVINRNSPGETQFAQQDTAKQNENAAEKIEKTPVANIDEKEAAAENNAENEKKNANELKRQATGGTLAQHPEKNKNRNKNYNNIKDNPVHQEPQIQRDHLAYMQPIAPALAAEQPTAELTGEKAGSKRQPYTLTASSDIKSYLTLREMLAKYSTDRLMQGIDDKPLAKELSNKRISKKGKRIQVAGWCLQKVTGKTVQVKTTYDDQGKLTAYHISAGRLKFGKTFASR